MLTLIEHLARPYRDEKHRLTRQLLKIFALGVDEASNSTVSGVSMFEVGELLKIQGVGPVLLQLKSLLTEASGYIEILAGI
jgi:hypothetical protein